MRGILSLSWLVAALGLAMPVFASYAQEQQPDAAAAVADTPGPSMPVIDSDEPKAGTAVSDDNAYAWPVVHGPAPIIEVPAVTPDISTQPEPAIEPKAGQQTGQQTERQQSVFPIGALVRDRLPKAVQGADASDETMALSAVYAARRDEAIWVTPLGLNTKGVNAIAELKQAGDWGLEAGDYVLPSLPDAAGSTTELPREQLADAEMKLSFAVLAYARDARGGRIADPSKQLSSYLDRQPQIIEPRILLDELAEAEDPGEMLRKLHPQHPQFEMLRQKYLAMRTKTAESSGLVRLPSSGPKLVPGMKHADIAVLRQRLNAGTAQAGGISADPTIYDTTLEEAVKAYQTSQGKKPDGIVGRSTRTALNDIQVPDPKRLLANMEQWRWMPAELGDTYVSVNIPEFMVRIVQNGKVTFEERIVTGQLDKQTPVFSDQLETIIFHPRWNVPESIKVLELYPSLARGGGSFQRQGLKLMRNGREVSPSSVDWGSADIRNYDVFQPSGDRNVLGLVKFVFPNKHGVYLHDTTAKGLFEEPSRPFSHGCMRVRNPLQFAAALLMIDKAWPATRVNEILDSNPDEVPVAVESRIPVHVTYFTDVVDDAGEERIFKDVYGHEQRIKLALAGRFDQIAVGADHLAPVPFRRVQYAQSPDDWGNIFGGSQSYSDDAGTTGSVKKQTLGNFLQNVFGGFDKPAPAKRRRKAN